MRKRGLVLSAMLLCLVFVNACGAQESNREPMASTGYPSEEIQRASVYYNGALYLYTADGFDRPLDEAFTKVGAVGQVDNMDYPSTDFVGTRVDVGQEVYANREDTSKIYVKYDKGYAVFERTQEDEETKMQETALPESGALEASATVSEPSEPTHGGDFSERYFEKDGKSYEKIRDLKDGGYDWASVLTGGTAPNDKNGVVDYNAQIRTFERLDGRTQLEVRRWDNLLYSAGDYLIYEYDNTIHVAKYLDLYNPVLSYDKGGTFGLVTKVTDGYMVADTLAFTVSFYDENFGLVRNVEGYRSMENGGGYCDGLMAVRDMKTGLMGFMDQKGDITIPCKYGNVSDFSNGYASVLTGASLTPYTEDGGAISMFDARGGQWAIIDTSGDFVLEPSEQFENRESADPDNSCYGGARRFSPVREDGTVDFLAVDEGERVIETVKLP